MVRSLKHVAVLSLLAAAVLACRSDFSVSTTVDPLTIFPRQATYVWDFDSSHAPVEPRLEPLELTRVLVDQADAAFAQHGYRRVPDAQAAGYRMTYEVELRTILEADESHTLTTVWLFLYELPGDRQVWTGAAAGDLHVGLSDAERHKRLRKVMDEMLKDFPPAQRG